MEDLRDWSELQQQARAARREWGHEESFRSSTVVRKRFASLRDGLRPPLTPGTAEQPGWSSDRRPHLWPGTNAGTNAHQNGGVTHSQTESIHAQIRLRPTNDG